MQFVIAEVERLVGNRRLQFDGVRRNSIPTVRRKAYVRRGLGGDVRGNRRQKEIR